MNLFDILNSPWAISPEVLLTIHDVARVHARGERVDIEAIEAKLGRPMVSEPQGYTVRDGVAVLPIEGVIGKRMNMFTQISGGTSSQLAARDLAAAVADPSVHSVILAIDSPGGTVDGTKALADAVYAAREKKPVVTLADGTMASAAYWIGSAAQAAYISSSTTQVGSIGVVAKHTDVSGAEAQQGIKTTEITAGKFKRVASQYGPLTETGAQSIQDHVDYVYSIFVEDVAKHRGVSAEKVLQDMADGRVFTGKQAVAAGLVDGITSLDALIGQLNAGRKARVQVTHPKASGATMPQTVDQIRAESPEAVEQLIAHGAAQERARIQGVENAVLPGHEALVASMKFDGKTSPGDAALAVMAAERKARGDAAKALAGDAPDPVKTAATNPVEPPAAKEKTKAELTAEAETLAAQEGIPLIDALKKLGVR